MILKGRTIGVVGAGFSGAVIARELADAGADVSVFDRRDHLAGNCHTARDPETGVLAHVYGPHIFHTEDLGVWHYVQRFATFLPYVNRVKAVARGRVYSLPINLLTINQFFAKTFNPQEAEAFLKTLGEGREGDPDHFEAQGLRLLGRDLYEAFFKGYTEKQWGVSATRLPASILKRLPVRFTYEDNYFSHPYQGIPKDGYTALVENLLDHPAIRVFLKTPIDRSQAKSFDHLFVSAPLDAWFGDVEGSLSYRTLDFEVIRGSGDFQGCAVMNYCDADIPWTRISEHKHFAPWESHEKTLCFREYSRACGPLDTPFYPTRLAESLGVLRLYVDRAQRETRQTFLGRLGTYRYLDMDVTIREALKISALYLDSVVRDTQMPAFLKSPLDG